LSHAKQKEFMPILSSTAVAMPASASFSPWPVSMSDGLHDANVMDQAVGRESCSGCCSSEVFMVLWKLGPIQESCLVGVG
jgi:hypothetical protein